jgi:outer membrane lipoprotein-sorting protein
MIRKLALTAFIMCLVLATRAQTVDEILTKYFESTGGVEKWKALKSRKSVGKISFQNMDFPLAMYERAPNKMRLEFSVQGLQIIQAYDGTDAWMINPLQGGTAAVKMSDEEAKEFKDNDFEDEFIDYKTKGHGVELLGSEEIEGVKCHKIQLVKNKTTEKEDVTEVHFIDSENFVPIMIVTYAKSGPAKGQEMKTYLSDYQDVNGLMMPFFIEVKSSGATVQKITVDKVTLDEAIEDKFFAFPK